MRKLTVLCFTLLITLCSFANDIDKAWEALNHNDIKAAQLYVQKAKLDPSSAFDAYVTDILIRTFNGQDRYVDGFLEKLDKQQYKNEYLYAMWFNGAVMGEYGKKKEEQLSFISRILASNQYNGSIQSAAHYVKGMHHVFSNETDKAKAEWKAIGALENWQLAGPFENISGTGINTDYGPLEHADGTTTFKALNNVDVTWFTPARMNNEGWIFTAAHIPENTAVVYAQTFVYSPVDKKVILNAGGNGALKIWVNDGLVITESKERTTELDYYKNTCQLHQGYNRVLVQMGYVDNNMPNFIVRFTDDGFNAIKDLKTTSVVQPYTKSNAAAGTGIRHFAEKYFEDRISADNKNLLNYILLSQVYLRNGRLTEARQVVQKALAMAPDNSLLRFELLQCLSKAGNKTLLLQELESLKEKSPESYIVYKVNIDKLINEEKYDEAAEEIKKMEALYGEDETTIDTKIKLLSGQKKYEELIKAIEAAYKRYPDNVTFLQYQYRIKKDAMKDVKGAIALYEKFFKTNYNYSLLSELISAYSEQGMSQKQLDLLKVLHDDSGYDPRFSNSLSDYYFNKQDYSKALTYAQEALQLAPFVSTYWKNVAIIQEQINKKEAIENYRKALYYDRTSYDSRKKLNALEQKPDLYKLLPQNDAYAIIKKAPATNNENNFVYLLDEKSTIIYEEGASEEYTTTIVKIYNEKGIDTWKEYYISYNSYWQTLMVEKGEVIKANGTKVPAEINDEVIIFTGLQAGDAIYIKYRIQNYSKGKIGRAFSDKYVFNAFQPCQLVRYCLITPKNYNYKAQLLNGTVNPTVKEEGDYKISTWESKDLPAIKSEPLMPVAVDLATVLHLSTLQNWNEVAHWYSDISYQDIADDYDLNTLYAEIFSGKKGLTDLEKAKTIYEYIVSNIRYSSIPFRQSGLVPQSITKIINTKLGDCKDLASLFVALADKAGLQAQLVLVDTRDNGAKNVVLPTMAFNHCIALLKAGGKDYYLELTDSQLPFNSMPQNLNGASSLIIPRQGDKTIVDLKQIPFTNRTPDKMIRIIDVTITGKDVKFVVASNRTGALTTFSRENYKNLPPEKQKEDWLDNISGSYKNPVKLDTVSFEGLYTLSDSVNINYAYTVKNEVIEAGSMKMLKVPFVDVVAANDLFPADSRNFPIEYSNYENTDVYESSITINLTAGQKFVEVPPSKTFSFNKSVYTIKYTKVGETLKVYRYASLDRTNITAGDYGKLKQFFNDIVESETKFLVFK